MGLNLILVIVGLIICFGGIYLRRVCSGILGFVCGVLGALAFAIVTVGLWHISDDSTILAVVICGIVCAILSAIYYKVCAAISSFLSTFAFMIILLALAGDRDSEMGIIALAAIIALVIAGISIKFYDYSFIITSAVVGAFIASVGGYGLVNDYDLEDMLSVIIWGSSSELSPVLVATIVLSIIGFCVQLRRLKLAGSTKNDSKQGDGIDHEQFRQTVASISGQAKKIGQAAAPAFQNVSNQATEIWNQASTEKGRADLKEEVLREKLLFIAPVIAFLVIPLINKIIGYGGYTFFSWIRNIASAVSLGTLIYFILKKDRRFAFFYTLLYTVGYIVFILINIPILRYYGFWYVLIELLNYLIIWFVLDVVSTKIKREEIKPIILLLIGAIMDIYIINWLAQFNIYLFFNFYTFAFLVVAFITVFLLFKTRDNISIISFNSIQNANSTVDHQASVCQSASSTSAKIPEKPQLVYCPNCGAKLDSDDLFCVNCGCKIK